MAYLTCEALSVGYEGVPVAQDITFSVGSGDAVCVVGDNGAGKSTLVKTLLGLLPPLAGRIVFADGACAGEVGYLPQAVESQRDFPASAWEVVLSGRASRLGRRPFYSKADRDAAAHALARVGASELRDRPFGTLSGGQQQRVLLARSIASGARLLVFDEPVSGLDPEAAESFYSIADELRRDGAGVVSVTHDIAGALPHATHVLMLAPDGASFCGVGEWPLRKGGALWEA